MKKKVKSFVALILSVMFFLQQAYVLPVLASTITGITNGGSGTFNINLKLQTPAPVLGTITVLSCRKVTLQT